MSARRILVVDDEPVVTEVVARYLERERYAVTATGDGHAALQQFAAIRPHLVVLDLMLPGIDGMEICRRIRAESRIPVIILTARGDEMDRIAGLEIGADDYLAKPFSPRELVARVKAVLRRTYDENEPEPRGPVVGNGIRIDPRTREVDIDGRSVELTVREFDLLHFLATHPSEVFSREHLLDRVWSSDWYGDPSTVTVHVRRLRTKVEADPEHPNHIKTVWGVGYKWEP